MLPLFVLMGFFDTPSPSNNIGVSENHDASTIRTITVNALGVPGGQTIFVAVTLTDTANVATLDVEDDQGNVYVPDIHNQSPNGQFELALFRCTNNVALDPGDEIRITGVISGKAVVASAFHLGGIALNDPLDQTNGASSQVGGSPLISGNVTNEFQSALLIGLAGLANNVNTLVQDPDFLDTIEGGVTDGDGAATSGRVLIIGLKLISDIELNDYRPSQSGSNNNWMSAIASYKMDVIEGASDSGVDLILRRRRRRKPRRG